MLSDNDLRKAYDKFGKDHAKPQEGFADPAEFFTSIFGGEAFVDWIGEISLMKDLTATMDITMQEEMEQAEQEAAQAGEPGQPPHSAPGDEDFPGMDEAIKESLKQQEAATAATSEHTSPAPPPPKVVVEEEGDAAAAKAAKAHSSGAPTPTMPPRSNATSPAPSSSSRSRTQIPLRPALTDKAHDEAATAESDMSEEALKRKEKKKGGLTREQREQLVAYERERARIRQERVDTLSQKLLDRISVWTETDKGMDVTHAFQEKTRLEVENLKMESFGIDILHAIGQTYMSKASALLRSQKFLGIGGFFSRLRDKGTLVKDTWSTISSAIDAQQTMEDMAKMEERGGDDWTDERRVEYERRVTGKILTAAWRGSKFEIQSVLRDVCDAVLNEKKASLQKRLERAQALVLIGDVFIKVRIPPIPPSFTSLHPQPHPQPPDISSAVTLLTRYDLCRLSAHPRRRATIWCSSSSWPRRPSRRTRRRSRGRRRTAGVSTRSPRPRQRRRYLRMLRTCLSLDRWIRKLQVSNAWID